MVSRKGDRPSRARRKAELARADSTVLSQDGSRHTKRRNSQRARCATRRANKSITMLCWLAAVFRGVVIQFEPIGSPIRQKDHHSCPERNKKNARLIAHHERPFLLLCPGLSFLESPYPYFHLAVPWLFSAHILALTAPSFKTADWQSPFNRHTG